MFLRDIWPPPGNRRSVHDTIVTREMFRRKYADVFKGDEALAGVKVTDQKLPDWPASSTYIQNPPYFRGMTKTPSG